MIAFRVVVLLALLFLGGCYIPSGNYVLKDTKVGRQTHLEIVCPDGMRVIRVTKEEAIINCPNLTIR